MNQLKVKRLLTLLVILTNNCIGQNLLLNSSFEDTIQCPYFPSQIDKALHWFQPSINSNSSDLFNSCSTRANVGVPNNFSGIQSPRTGSGYAGIYFNVDTVNIREYIEGQLISPLQEGKIYCVSFYVSLADTSSKAISNAGAYLSQDSLLYNGYQTINTVIPQIQNSVTNFLNSKTEWMKVSGYFIANGGERFITIGNFNIPSNTPVQNVLGGGYPSSYYYIDDVSVIYCDSLQSLGHLNLENKIIVQPNPFYDRLTVEINDINETDFIIYDLSFRQCLKHTFVTMTTINTEHLAKGMYLYLVRQKNGIIKIGKVIKE